MRNKKRFSEGDYGLCIVVFLLVLIGLTAIYSASYHVESVALKNNFIKQIIWFIISFFALIITVIIPLKFFKAISYWFYVLSLLLLLSTLFMNQVADVNRWITIGFIKLQPSEFVKIALLLALANFLSKERRDLTKLKDVGLSFGFLLLPFLIVIKQPDLGTALVFLSLILPLLYWAGMPSYLLFTIIIPFISLLTAFNYYSFLVSMIIIAAILFFFRRGLIFFLFNFILNIGVGLITPLLWNKLHDYQQHRILTFLGLELDPHGASYQVIQSIVAIGSGGLWGKGLLNGTQTQLRFLPAQHTDFIFSVIGEEAGFLGISFVLILFYIILMRGIYIASVTRNKFASLMAIGIITIIGFHVIVTVSMTAGIMPVTGIPLPFVSYGGSSLVANMVLIGLLINTSIRRYKY